MRSLCWLLLVCSFDAARVAVGNSQAVERAVGHAMSSVAKNSFPGVAEAAAKLLMGAFARSMDGIRGSKLVRELKYLVHPPSTDPESFKNAISGIGPGLVSYLGCIDRLGSDQRPSAVQVLSRDRCGSLLSSLSRQTPFRQPQTAFKRMEGLETKLQLISAVPESAPMNSPHGGPPNADPDNLTSAVRSVLAVFEEDLDKHYSSFARSLMSSSDHEEAKVFLRRIGPHLMAALQLAWETVERLPPAERTTHSRRLAAAARDLAQLDACAQEAANELQPLLEDYPVIAYNSTPPLTLAELQLTKFPQQRGDSFVVPLVQAVKACRIRYGCAAIEVHGFSFENMEQRLSGLQDLGRGGTGSAKAATVKGRKCGKFEFAHGGWKDRQRTPSNSQKGKRRVGGQRQQKSAEGGPIGFQESCGKDTLSVAVAKGKPA
ncbi:hypothetical protein cyc_01962 [Cyclospora cayetanensis]|uniref:Uncharacterized protein n=1 Tax=Cyclospora cayetanensis TaxID=88456 RepID=A0A1D3D305_9EIME|nr:hypothetical protein cyc_01962 [Cyclospora cayetanensis]